MKFSYTALTSDNQQVSGVLDLENRDAAQAELHKMGVAILSLNEVSENDFELIKKRQQEEKAKKGIQTFNFTCVDPQGKEIKGTIDADNAFSAYKRLRLEYFFDVKELYATNADDRLRATQNAQLNLFASQLPASSMPPNTTTQTLADQEEVLNQDLIQEVDKMIANVKKALADYQNLFSQSMISTIQNKLGELERIRTSNNVKHVTDLSEEIYQLIQNPDQIDLSDNQADYQRFVQNINSQPIKNEQSDLYQKAIAMTGAKNLFRNIAQKLKKLPDLQKPEKNAGPSLIEKLKLKLSFFKKTKTVPDPDFVSNPITDAKTIAPTIDTIDESTPEEKHDFTFLFIEIDSFIAWLLTFYVIYFFLVDFSIEKGIGLNQEFTLKTIKNPLILNITLLLFVSHFILRLRNRYLQHHLVANLFLFFLTIGFYTFVIINY